MVMEDNFLTLLKLAFQEDLGAEGDVTSEAVFNDERARGRLFSRQQGVFCGGEYFARAFRFIDDDIHISMHRRDGEEILKDEEIGEITGRTASLLRAERTALNFLAFLSGIATETRKFVSAAHAYGNTVIIDTRKTLPGYRVLSKYAVKTGGGANHRMGLYDMVLIKDNHIAACGGIENAVRQVRAVWGSSYKIEVECTTLSQVQEAVALGVDRIMLDNMAPDQSRTALSLIGASAESEASGDMDLEKVREYADLGFDFISVGRLTHSVSSFNFSLQLEEI
jgi:nicotinate-nucleotide pyrophosphorylase (carboxylating)